MSRLASEAGTRGGLIAPFLLQETDLQVRLQYFWRDDEFQDRAVIAKMAAHPDFGLLAKLMREQEEWKLPDFRQWGRVYQLRFQPSVQAPSILFPSVHQT